MNRIRFCKVSLLAFRAVRAGVERRGRVVYSHAPVPDKRKRSAEKIVPIVLAAGPSRHLPFPKALVRFGKKTALEIAVENCRGFERPIVVLGSGAAQIRHAIPAGVRVVVNRRWRAGQLSSLLAALRWVPQGAPFLVLPLDHPLLTPAIVRRLSRAFVRRNAEHMIFLPICRGRVGHPAIFAPEIRGELRRAQTAREVVYRDPRRVKFVKVTSAGIWLDFDDAASYRRCLSEYERRFERRKRKREAK
jgi:CTP:molybdopterin cytidylyltransferase MocA